MPTKNTWLMPENLKLLRDALRDQARQLGRAARAAAATSPLKERRLRVKWQATRALLNDVKAKIGA